MQEQNRKVYPQTSLCHLDIEDAFDQSVCEDPLESMFHSVELKRMGSKYLSGRIIL